MFLELFLWRCTIYGGNSVVNTQIGICLQMLTEQTEDKQTAIRVKTKQAYVYKTTGRQTNGNK